MTSFRPYEPDQQLLLPPPSASWPRATRRTIGRSAGCREQHLAAFERLFVHVVQIAPDAGLVRMGTLAIDGSKIRANASKHKAMSYERMQQEEKRLRREIRALTGRAAKRDAAEDVQRKHLAEPPFGWIKQGLGFRQFSLRGLQKVTGEFNLVCLALNLRRMATMIRWA